MIGEYLLENYDAYDLNGDGRISYILFKGEQGNAEAEYRTQYAVEDANALLTEAGKPELEFYDPNNSDKYLVDRNGSWSAAAAQEYMTTALSTNNDSNNNMIELVICNNDAMAEGAITALDTHRLQSGRRETRPSPCSALTPPTRPKTLIAAGQHGRHHQAGRRRHGGSAIAQCHLPRTPPAGAALMDGIADKLHGGRQPVAKIRIPYADLHSAE